MQITETNAYPSIADVVLRDGSTARIRPVRTDDAPALLEFLSGLSPDSIALRFFGGGVNLKAIAKWAADIDNKSRFGLIATIGERIAAHGAYVGINRDRAEVALEVDDRWHGRGLGTILLGHLAHAAHANGISAFEARILPQNHRMIDLVREIGFPIEMRSEPGEILVEFPTSTSPEAVDRFDRREQSAAVAALHRFLAPRSVAVIGAGRSRGSIGGEVFHNLIAGGFTGPVYPVNPKAGVVQSVVAYPSISDVPGPVDMAVIVVPAAGVIDVARECGHAGVPSLVVISAGFGETGAAGRDQERELVDVCRTFGMRLIGPNCMGILNADPTVSMNATFAPMFPPHGHVGFLSQSGALGLAVMDYARELGLGLSSFVSIGNKADVSGNDLLQYWESDDDTNLILLYLESFGNPRRFSRLARRIGKTKPIIAVKSGRSQAGARATSSHTGAMLQSSDVTVAALFAQAGVIRTDTLGEMFDVATLLGSQPPPAGRRVGILTNAGGPAILCADTCEASGLTVPQPPQDVRDALAAFLPAEASTSNPVDMIASATGDDYRRAIEILGAWDDIDALVVIFIPPLVTRADEVAEAIKTGAAALKRDIPLLAVFMSSKGVPPELRSHDVRIPSYPFPENAAHALAKAVAYGEWRDRDPGVVATIPGVRPEEAAAILSKAVLDGGTWLAPADVAALLACYGLPVIETQIVATPADAGRAAAAIAGPVALKAVADGLIHKTEQHAVLLSLTGGHAVEAAALEMHARIPGVHGFVVQPMAPPGIEMLVGVVNDPLFGPLVACGAGGTAAELIHDVSVALTPLADVDVRAMIRSLATFPLLEGYRGAPAANIAALEDVLLRIGAMVESHPEIAEMDCNPVIVHADGAVIVDVRVRAELARAPAPVGARRRI